MKIGVMTFHWATNYGAALQSYALVKHLQQTGHDAELIGYLPKALMWKLRLFDVYLKRFANIRRIGKFKSFQKMLTVSDKTYTSHKALCRMQKRYDAVIAGSDQIWNESFLMTAERSPTASYYLDFVPPGVRRLSYAASFGTNVLTDNLVKYGVSELKQFDAVSVREENATAMLAQEGIHAVAVCDPTLLIDPRDYEAILERGANGAKVDVFNFMLRKGRESSDQTEAYVLSHCFADRSYLEKNILTVEQWLWRLKNCAFVVTDSFHCTVFAILFHKPFLAVNDKNCSMNARIKTLTERLGLEHRVVDRFDPDRIGQIIAAQDIDWESVDEKRHQWAAESAQFLRENLKGHN